MLCARRVIRSKRSSGSLSNKPERTSVSRRDDSLLGFLGACIRVLLLSGSNAQAICLLSVDHCALLSVIHR